MSAQSLFAADALWPGPLLVARLLAQVPELREVLLIDDIDPALPPTRQYPAALVMLDSFGPQAADPQQLVADAQQDWVVAIAVQSVAADLDRSMRAVGPLASKLIKALQGWVPDGQRNPFAWRRALRVSRSPSHTYYPFVFSLQVVTA